jgi:chromosome segregation ATPase
MIFTEGDLIVLGIVIIMMFLFRRIDRNSKSLEKVRRYAEKARGELDKLVEEKRNQLKDLSVDIDVQDRTGREILKRIVANNEELIAHEDNVKEKLELVQDLQDRMDQLNDMTALVDENMQKVANESQYVDMVGGRLKESQKSVEELHRRLESILDEFDHKNLEKLEVTKTSVMEDYQTRLNLISEQLDDTSLGIDKFRTELNDMVRIQEEQKEARIIDFADRVAELEEGYTQKLESAANRAELLEEEVFTVLDEKIRQKSDRLEENWFHGMNELKEQVASQVGDIRTDLETGREQLSLFNTDMSRIREELSESISEYAESAGREMERIQAKREAFNREQTEYQERMDSALKNIREELTRRMAEVTSQITGAAEASELEAMKVVDQRMAEYEEVIRNRYEKLDSFSSDLDSLDTSLRESMAEQESRFREGMEAFSLEMEAGQTKERERSDTRLSEVRLMIGEIEKELNQLKQQAYDNVSEKLQLFEDDFFTDLKKRESSMQESFSEWHKSVELQLEDIGNNAQRDREEVERNSMAQINRKMSELQTRVVDQFDRFQDQVKNFQTNVTEQIESGEKSIIDYRHVVHEEWEKHRSEALAYLDEGMGNFDSDIDSRLGELKKNMDGQIEFMASSVESKRADLVNLIDKTQTEFNQWQIHMDQQMRSNETSLENDLDEFKNMISLTVSDLKNTFTTQKEELVIASNKDRVEVRRDISELFEKIAALNNELSGKSEQTLELFNNKSEQYLIEYQQRFREAQNDSDEKIKLMRSTLVDTKEKMDGYQNMMHNRIDESYRTLLANVEKIEEKQQDFINQTRIFEQADALKNSLESDIAQLEGQIDLIRQSRDELTPIREECERVLGAYEGVSAKMASFLKEQQKIDLLDGKVARIINLSDAIDIKLDQVSDADENMQGYMVRLHQMEDLHKEISRRYKELEKKSSVVDATTQSVDRNFQMLGRIEEGLTGISEDLVPLKGSLQDVKRNTDTLLENKDQVDYIVNNVTNLDAVISDFDGRMKKMEKAREWLASTETRLENISREAQEKVKLLGDLASRDSRKGSARSLGSPDMNTREMVIQLARQGWSSEEISRYVKLSRGEVELILELSPSEGEDA